MSNRSARTKLQTLQGHVHSTRQRLPYQIHPLHTNSSHRQPQSMPTGQHHYKRVWHHRTQAAKKGNASWTQCGR